MSADRAAQAYSRFGETLKNLERTLTLPASNEDYRNSAILAFMLAEEAMWKALKQVLFHYVGVEVYGPKPALQEAFAQGWLGTEDTVWLAMVEDRNQVVHVYNKQLATSIYEHLPLYATLMRRLYAGLAAKYEALIP